MGKQRCQYFVMINNLQVFKFLSNPEFCIFLSWTWPPFPNSYVIPAVLFNPWFIIPDCRHNHNDRQCNKETFCSKLCRNFAELSQDHMWCFLDIVRLTESKLYFTTIPGADTGFSGAERLTQKQSRQVNGSENGKILFVGYSYMLLDGLMRTFLLSHTHMPNLEFLPHKKK